MENLCKSLHNYIQLSNVLYIQGLMRLLPLTGSQLVLFHSWWCVYQVSHLLQNCLYTVLGMEGWNICDITFNRSMKPNVGAGYKLVGIHWPVIRKIGNNLRGGTFPCCLLRTITCIHPLQPHASFSIIIFSLLELDQVSCIIHLILYMFYICICCVCIYIYVYICFLYVWTFVLWKCVLWDVFTVFDTHRLSTFCKPITITITI